MTTKLIFRRAVVFLVVLFVALSFVFLPPSGFASGGEKKEGKPEKRATQTRSSRKSKKPPKKDDHSAGDFTIGGDEKIDSKSFDAEAGEFDAVDAVLLLDSSGSMRRTDPQGLRDQAAKLFLRFLGEGDRVAVFKFDSEVQQLSEFTSITVETISALDESIAKVGAEGRFTDLEAPISAAFSLLQSAGRRDARKCVVLLSDGQMDPPPEHGTAEALISKVRDSVLPLYRQRGYALYTLAMSQEADQSLLADFAKEGQGLSWYAPDVNTIHMRFSDLFLALKKPQTVSLENGGFEIDSDVQEATFYVAKKEAGQRVTLVNPKGEEVTELQISPQIKWFKGELYEVITIKHPMPGPWSVRGIETPEGFATLITDLKLLVKWPESNLNVGDHVKVSVQLRSRDKPMNEPGLKDITYFKYKIVEAKGGSGSSGVFNDEGKDGDDTAGDGVYSTTVQVPEEGQYKALIGVTSPTFTRGQQIPFNVYKSLVSLSLEKADEFQNKPEQFHVTLGAQASKLRNVETQLIAKNTETNKALAYRLKAEGRSPTEFDFLTSKLAPGTYKISARVSAKDPKKQEPVKGSSAEIEYTARTQNEKESAGEENVDVEEVVGSAEGEEDAAPKVDNSGVYIGLATVGVAILWAVAAVLFVFKRLDFGKNLPQKEQAYVRPKELEEHLSALKAKLSERRRTANPQDRVIFEILPDAYPEKQETPPQVEEATTA